MKETLILSNNYSNKVKISKTLIILFGLWYPLSRILFVNDHELASNFTLIFILGIISFSFLSGRFAFAFQHTNQFGSLLLIFLGCTFFGTLFANDVSDSLEKWFRIFMSGILCLAVSGFKFKSETIYSFFKWYNIGFAFLCLLSLMDYFGYLEIIGFNEAVTSMSGNTSSQIVITDISGPYRQRSQFSANLAVVFPICMYYVAKSKTDRILWTVICLIIVITTILTFSRMIYVSLVFVFLFYLFFKIYSPKFMLILTILLVLASSFISADLINYIDIGYKSLEERFMQIEDGHAGDTWRQDALLITIRDLQTRPFGLGFNNIWSPKMGKIANPHSLFTAYFRAGGLIGLLSFLMLLLVLFKQVSLRKKNPLVVPLIGACFSVVLYGTTHLAISVMFWVFVGLLFSIRLDIKTRTQINK